MENFVDDNIICYHSSLNDLTFKGFTSSNLNVFFAICYFLKGIGNEERQISLKKLLISTDIKRETTLKKGLEKTLNKFKEIDEKFFFKFEIDEENLSIILNPAYTYLFFPSYLYQRS